MAEPDKPTQEATELLWADHRAVLEAYERYEEVYGEEKEEISDHLIKILTAHLEIEEELFYPVLEDATARRGGADDRREDATARRGGADDRREDAT
ncbi:MAG: hemerythrin domain-containing protein, partial [Patescibacteria group bacterium]|nr:hemerythrin domain-containing protein [Patescibacteria group bacterium]